MIVPVIFTLDPLYENLSQTWVFHKAAYFVKQNSGFVIAQEQYFGQLDKQRDILPQFFQEDMCRMFEYKILNDSVIRNIEKLVIPKQMETCFIRKHGTQSDAYMASFLESWPELEDYLYRQILSMQKKLGEAVEAFTCLTYLRFMKNIGERLGIPVIYYEWGPFRYSTYRNTAYFDIDAEYRNINEKYKQFAQCGHEGLPILSEKEILALFLKQDKLDYLEKAENHFEKYEVGIAGGYGSLTESSAYCRQNLVELYNAAKKRFTEEEIAVRYHPGDPVHMKLGVKNEIYGDLVFFISECRRIMCIASNVEFEAMLYGKKVYDAGDYRFHGIVNKYIEDMEDQGVSIEVINFIAFVILIPFELLNSVDYIRYRLGGPNLESIYLYHMEYYLKCIGICWEEWKKEPGSRLEMIMKARGKAAQLFPKHVKPEAGNRELLADIWQYRNCIEALRQESAGKDNEIETMKNQLQSFIEEHQKEIEKHQEKWEWLENKSNDLQKELEQMKQQAESNASEKEHAWNRCKELEEQNQILINSVSMRITKPLRFIKKCFRM